MRKERKVQRARGVVVSAGPLGTNTLLQRCRLGGSLPRISARLGELVRTNSEAILAVTVPEDYPENLIKRVAITSSIYPDAHTHIETVTYGNDGDSMSRLNTLLTGDGTRATRPLKLLGQIIRHPKRFVQVVRPKNWSRRTIIILVMQTLDNAIALRPKQGPFKTLWLSTEQDPERPIPTFIPVANRAAEWFAERTGGIAQSSFTEAALNIPTTAHILGGAVIGADAEHGVVDAHQHVFGYENLLVCDGSAVPANVGVNPEPHDHRTCRACDEPCADGRLRPGSPRSPCRCTQLVHRAVLRQVAHHERLQTGSVAIDDPVPVHQRDVIVAGPCPDVVVTVARRSSHCRYHRAARRFDLSGWPRRANRPRSRRHRFHPKWCHCRPPQAARCGRLPLPASFRFRCWDVPRGGRSMANRHDLPRRPRVARTPTCRRL